MGTKIVFVAVVFHIFFVLLAVSFVRAMLTPAGSVPRTEMWKKAQFGISKDQNARIQGLVNECDFEKITPDDVKFIRSLKVVERKQKNGNYRYCPTCMMFKPDRCHHCRVC